VVYPHEDCEPVRFEFDSNLYVQKYTKTQFAGQDCHQKIIGLLRAIESLFRDLKVDDEGGFWDTGDPSILRGHFDSIRGVIEDTLNKDPGARSNVKTPNGRIIDLST
jgi:hypothetical protein